MGSISYIKTSDYHYTITASGAPVAREVYKLFAINTGGAITVSQYTAVLGDNIQNIIDGLFASTSATYQVSKTTTQYLVDLSSDEGKIVASSVEHPADIGGTGDGYGLKYICTFDPIGPASDIPVYSLRIYQKDYSGDAVNVIGGTTVALQSWQTDDPKAPIKGCSLTFSIINEGSLPLDLFLSTEDDEFKVRLFYFENIKFEGFLVQDDFSEILVDFRHEINLSANDNLGLLKDVTLDSAPINYNPVYNTSDTFSTVAPNTLVVSSTLASEIQPGDLLQIQNLVSNTTYHVVDTTDSPNITVAETVATSPSPITADITILRPYLLDKITLLTLIKTCLKATNLSLITNIFCNFTETTINSNQSFLGQILIDPQTFLKDATNYQDCYTVLTSILQRFNCTLFQSNGVWNIVHWDELRYSGYAIPGFSYDSDFNLIGELKLNGESIIFGGFNKFQTGPNEDTVPENGLLRKVARPYQFDKETFNYKQPAQLLRNYNLQQVGALLRTYTTGSGDNLQIIKEYSAPWWYNQIFYSEPTAIFFIRVIFDAINNELERYLVVVNEAGTVAGSAMSYKIEATAGDGFKFSFQTRTSNSQTGGVALQTHIILYDGVHPFNSYVGGEQTGVPTLGDWGGNTSNGWALHLDDSENSNVWHNVEVDALENRIPYDGLLYFYLDNNTSGANTENHYKDINLEYIISINQSTKIIGQSHTSSQTGVIKQNEDIEIFVDDSPRNSIAGTLFTNEMNGVLQQRTSRWRLNNGLDSRRLGDLVTFETLFWRRKARTILDGTFYGVVSANTGGNHISMLGVFNCTIFPGLTFIPGTMEIDYKNNKFTGTLWEICYDGEADTDLSAKYIFNYLYSAT